MGPPRVPFPPHERNRTPFRNSFVTAPRAPPPLEASSSVRPSAEELDVKGSLGPTRHFSSIPFLTRKERNREDGRPPTLVGERGAFGRREQFGADRFASLPLVGLSVRAPAPGSVNAVTALESCARHVPPRPHGAQFP